MAATPLTVDLNWSGGGISGPSAVAAQTPFTISRTYTISNSVPGGVTSSAFTIGYYSSPDGSFASATLLGSETVATGQVAGTYSGASPSLQFSTGGTYYLLARLDALDDFLPNGLGFDALDKIPGDLEIHIGFQKCQADFPEGIARICLGYFAQAAQVPKSVLELVA